MIHLLKAKSNSFFGNSLMIFLIRFFPAFANLVVIIYFSHQLSKEAYGMYQNFWIQYYIFYPFVCMGIHLWLVTYSKVAVAGFFRQLRARYIALYLVWVVLLSILFGCLEYYGQGNLFLMPLLFLLLTPVCAILESFLIICKRYQLLVILNVGYAALYVALHFHTIHAGHALPFLFWGICLLTAVKAIVCIADASRCYKKARPNAADSSAEALSTQKVSLMFHMGFFDVLQMLANSVDKFIISLLLPAAQSAIYFNGSMNVPFLPMLLSAASSAVLIQLATADSANEHQATAISMRNMGATLSAIVFPVFFFIVFFRYELFSVVFGAKYLPSVPIFLITSLALPLRAYSFNTPLQKLHKGRIINIGSLAELILACAIMYPLYVWFGLCGVAMSFVITTYLLAAFYIVQSAKYLKVPVLSMLPVKNWLIKLVILALIFYPAHSLLAGFCSVKTTFFVGGSIMAAAIAIAFYGDVRARTKQSSML